MSVTLTTKKIYDSFSGKFYDWKHLFHGHTYFGNPQLLPQLQMKI